MGESLLVAIWRGVTFVVTLVLHAIFETAVAWIVGGVLLLAAAALMLAAARRSRPSP